MKANSQKARAFAEEIESMVRRRGLNGDIVLAAVTLVLAKYGLEAEEKGLMDRGQLIENVAKSAKAMAESARKNEIS